MPFGVTGQIVLLVLLCGVARASGDWDTGVVDHGSDTDDDGWPDSVDCDPENPGTYPGAPEKAYDGIDQDCDGEDLEDQDDDGFVATEAGGSDCDDTDADVHPDASEVARDGIDQDCDGKDAGCVRNRSLSTLILLPGLLAALRRRRVDSTPGSEYSPVALGD